MMSSTDLILGRRFGFRHLGEGFGKNLVGLRFAPHGLSDDHEAVSDQNHFVDLFAKYDVDHK